VGYCWSWNVGGACKPPGGRPGGKGSRQRFLLCEEGKMYLEGENPGSGQGWGAPGSGLHCVAVKSVQFFSSIRLKAACDRVENIHKVLPLWRYWIHTVKSPNFVTEHNFVTTSKNFVRGHLGSCSRYQVCVKIQCQ
jgi:hypothetical protein